MIDRLRRKAICLFCLSNDILFKSINNQTIDQKSHPSARDVYFMEALKMRESINNFEIG